MRENLKDMNYGELVLVMRNPDHLKTVKNKKISLKTGLKLYEKNVINLHRLTIKEKRGAWEAFIKAFLSLPLYLDKGSAQDYSHHCSEMMESLQIENKAHSMSSD